MPVAVVAWPAKAHLFCYILGIEWQHAAYAVLANRTLVLEDGFAVVLWPYEGGCRQTHVTYSRA